MIARSGASVLLSLLIVAVAAVVIHRPEPPRLTVATTPPSVRPKTIARSAPVATPAIPWQEPDRPKVAIIATSQTVVPKRQTRSTPKRPEDAFTKVASGETLVDIVRRVYGPDASLEAVWKANRDQLPTPEASVRAGMILRTPELP